MLELDFLAHLLFQFLHENREMDGADPQIGSEIHLQVQFVAFISRGLHDGAHDPFDPLVRLRHDRGLYPILTGMGGGRIARGTRPDGPERLHPQMPQGVEPGNGAAQGVGLLSFPAGRNAQGVRLDVFDQAA